MLKKPSKLSLPVKEIYIAATLLGFFMMLPAMYTLWRIQWSDSIVFGLFTASTVFPLLGAMVATVVAHELCHLLAHPYFGFTRKSYVGIDKKTGFAYAQYLGAVTKLHFFVIGLAPLIIGTVLPFWMATLYPEWASFLAFVSIFNAVGAAGDVFIVLIVWRAVPNNMHLQGFCFGDLSKNQD